MILHAGRVHSTSMLPLRPGTFVCLTADRIQLQSAVACVSLRVLSAPHHRDIRGESHHSRLESWGAPTPSPPSAVGMSASRSAGRSLPAAAAATHANQLIVLPKRRLTQTEQFRILDRIERQQTEARHAAAEQHRRERADRAAAAAAAAAAQPSGTADDHGATGQTARQVREYKQHPSVYSRFHQLETPLVTAATNSSDAPMQLQLQDQLTHRQQLEQYAATQNITLKIECECIKMLCEGVQLLNQQRRINSLLRSQCANRSSRISSRIRSNAAVSLDLLFQCAPSSVTPLSCSTFCHLLDNDPHYLTPHAPSLSVVDRLDKSNIIDVCQLRRSAPA